MNLPGATNALLVLDHVSLSQAGSYSVRVGNAWGSTTSHDAVLTVGGGTRYVDASSFAPALPYDSWTNAAHVIQDAVDAAGTGDEIVVTNGIYATGGRAIYGTMTNRVAVDKPLAVRSVNGSQFAIIKGYQVPGITNGDGAIRCAYLTNGASLVGFTLSNRATRIAGDEIREESGGGVWCETDAVVSDCVLTGNSARYGGGARGGTLNNCILSGNVVGGLTNSSYYGGGAYGGTLNNCNVNGNSAAFGGGAIYSTSELLHFEQQFRYQQRRWSVWRHAK